MSESSHYEWIIHSRNQEQRLILIYSLVTLDETCFSMNHPWWPSKVKRCKFGFSLIFIELCRRDGSGTGRVTSASSWTCPRMAVRISILWSLRPRGRLVFEVTRTSVAILTLDLDIFVAIPLLSLFTHPFFTKVSIIIPFIIPSPSLPSNVTGWLLWLLTSCVPQIARSDE